MAHLLFQCLLILLFDIYSQNIDFITFFKLLANRMVKHDISSFFFFNYSDILDVNTLLHF